MQTIKFPRLKITLSEFTNIVNKARRGHQSTWFQGQVWVDNQYVQFELKGTWLFIYRVGDTHWDNTSNRTATQFQADLRKPFKASKQGTN